MPVPCLISFNKYQVDGKPVQLSQADGGITLGTTTLSVETWYELVERLRKSHIRSGFVRAPRPQRLPGRPLPWLLMKLFRKHFWY